MEDMTIMTKRINQQQSEYKTGWNISNYRFQLGILTVSSIVVVSYVKTGFETQSLTFLSTTVVADGVHVGDEWFAYIENQMMEGKGNSLYSRFCINNSNVDGSARAFEIVEVVAEVIVLELFP